jgi:broad specificity phosphatase PhoE
MTYLWLVRHGQTDWNVQGRWQGQTPDAPPLNAAGLAQAQTLAEQLADQAARDGIAFAALYSSDLLRARQTAEVIARRLGLPVCLDARLREAHLGAWEGMLGHEVALRYVAELDERRRDPVHSRPPQGESVYEVAARVGQAFDAIARASQPARGRRLARPGARGWAVPGRGPAAGGGLHAHPGSRGRAGGEVVGVEVGAIYCCSSLRINPASQAAPFGSISLQR